MSRSETAAETAFKDVAEELRQLRSRVLPSDRGTVDNAIDLLISTHNFLEEDDDLDVEDEELPPFTYGNPPVHMQLFCLGDIQLFAISIEPLTDAQHEELTRRCSFPIEWSLSPGTEMKSIRLGKIGVRPVYDRNGQLIGTCFDTFPFGQGLHGKLPKGGEV